MASGRRRVARAEWVSFGLGRVRLWRCWGVWVGEKHVGGEFVAAAAGERTDYVRGDSAGRADIVRMDAVQLRRMRGVACRLFFKSRRWRCIRRFESVSRLAKFCARMGRWASESALRGCEKFWEGFLRGYRAHLFFLPHELSGGQQQRTLIAQAIACEPSLVVADEPTASLDPTTQREILALSSRSATSLGLRLFSSPTIRAARGFADRVLVLYAGKVAEAGPTGAVLSSPQHPYTQALLKCLPRVDAGQAVRPKTLLPVIGEWRRAWPCFRKAASLNRDAKSEWRYAKFASRPRPCWKSS